MFRFILAAAILSLTPMISEAGGGGSKQRSGSVRVDNPYDISIPTAIVTKTQYNRLRDLISAGRFDDAENLFLSFGPQTISADSSLVYSNLRAGQYYAVGDDGFESFASSEFTVRAGQETNVTLVRLD